MSLEKFVLGEILAQSARTVVRRAVRTSDGVKVIVKTLISEYPTRHELEQIESEHAILLKLPGLPNVVQTYAMERDGDRPVMVEEDFGGEALFRGEKVVALGLDRFFAVASAVTSALESIHAHNIVHRDIKPSNIVANWDTKQIKLIDFDVALDLAEQSREIKPLFEGSLPYISPEQTGRMNRDLDYRTDYYSLGVTFFELLTGGLPFTATDTMGWVHCHMSRIPADVATINPAVPESLARIVHKLMDKNPDHRYQSAHGLLKDLERSERQYRLGGGDAGFALGANDVSQRFQISPGFHGRDPEIARVVEGLASASRGKTELVLLTGGAGVGKTRLLREVERHILSRQGWVVAGRMEESDRAIPYAAFVQVLRGLATQLLTETDVRLGEWKGVLNQAIAPSGRVLLDLVPELEPVLGIQPEIPALGPEEVRARFRRTLQAFIGAIASARAPLAVLLDDLQWADPQTIDTLAALVDSGDVKQLLVVAAFREGNPAATGAGTAGDLRQRTRMPPRMVELTPLSEQSLQELICATTRASVEASAPLAHTIHVKTGGNPFFVHELLNLLARDGAFHLIAAEGRWDCDRGAIDQAGVSANVVDLIAGRLQRLNAHTATVLCLGACLGETFDAALLPEMGNLPADQVMEALRDAVADGVLLHADHDGTRYRFQHARLHQAAYAMVPETDRRRAHAAIGRHLLAHGKVTDDGIFEVTGHLNRGRTLITEPGELRRLAELNVMAGQRAKRATAYAIAAGHLEIALELDSGLATDPTGGAAWRFEVTREHLDCLFLAGEVERANLGAAKLVEAAPDAISAASAQFLAARTFDYQARYAEEIEVIRQGLHRLGIELPKDMGEVERRIGEGIGRMQAFLAKHCVEDLPRLPRMTDPEKIVAMNLLFQLIPPAIQTCPPVFILAELIMFELATTHGVTVASAKNFVDCGIIQGGVLGDYATAYRLAQAGFELIKQYSPAPLEAGLNFVFANFVSHWRAPYRESLEAFARAKKIGRELGNVGHTTYAYALETQRVFAVGTELDECAAVVRNNCAYLRQVRAQGTLPAAFTVAQAIARLRGEPVDWSVPELSGTQPDTRPSGNGPFMFAHGQIEMLCGFVLGDLEAAMRGEAFATSLLRASAGIFAAADYHLFHGLILCRRWPALSPEEQAAASVALDHDLAKLANWAENCAENFAHKHRLLVAEAGRVRGAPLDEILIAYEESVAAAGQDFPHLRALANELQAEMWMARGYRKVARSLFQEAHYLYGRWGASVKVRQLESAHPEWFVASVSEGRDPTSASTMRSTMVGGALDLASAMKATRAISGEVTREGLYARLMATLVENAGAQRGCLMVVAEGGAIEVVSRVNPDGDAQARQDRPAGPIPLEDAEHVCVEMVRFVVRTGQAVMLDDASHHATYGNDAYIRKSNARSVLCLPVMQQGKVLAILYVENNAVTHAFTADRLQLLQLVASQAAVSITNARLYDSLEEKVAARTGELAARNVDLEQAHAALTTEMKTRQAVEIELRQAQKLEAVGRLASGVAHEINTPIQFVTDSVQFLKDATKDLLAFVDKLREVQRAVLADESAVDAANQATEAENDLDLAYLVENIPGAFERSLDGLERVATIVKSMKEFAHPDAKQMTAVDLNRAIESTLTMSRNEYKYVADIDLEFGELPMVQCHAGEVNQVILNIVVNAAHAIGDVVQGSDRRGRIAMRTRREGERVCIEIEDTGGGIPDAIRDRIFDPFFTTKEVGKGTGQGLAIARSVVVDKHGGELTCRSEVGKGTTFFIRLPIEGKREPSAASKAA